MMVQRLWYCFSLMHSVALGSRSYQFVAVALPTCPKEPLQAQRELYVCQIWGPTTLLSFHITCSMSLTSSIHSRCGKTSCHPSVWLTALKTSSTPFIAWTSADQKWESHHYRTSTGRNSPTVWSVQAEFFTHRFSWCIRYLPILCVAPDLLTCKQQSHPTGRMRSVLPTSSFFSVLATSPTLNGSVKIGSSLQDLSSGHSAVQTKVFLQQAFIQQQFLKLQEIFPRGFYKKQDLIHFVSTLTGAQDSFAERTRRTQHPNQDKFCPSELPISCRLAKQYGYHLHLGGPKFIHLATTLPQQEQHS